MKKFKLKRTVTSNGNYLYKGSFVYQYPNVADHGAAAADTRTFQLEYISVTSSEQDFSASFSVPVDALSYISSDDGDAVGPLPIEYAASHFKAGFLKPTPKAQPNEDYGYKAAPQQPVMPTAAPAPSPDYAAALAAGQAAIAPTASAPAIPYPGPKRPELLGETPAPLPAPTIPSTAPQAPTLRDYQAAQIEPSVGTDYKGHETLAHMVGGHTGHWHTGLKTLRELAVLRGDSDDALFWEHEIKALKEIELAVQADIQDYSVNGKEWRDFNTKQVEANNRALAETNQAYIKAMNHITSTLIDIGHAKPI